MIPYCPKCGSILLTDQPGQSDIDAFCASCNQTFNFDYCKIVFDDGEVVEADSDYVERLTNGSAKA